MSDAELDDLDGRDERDGERSVERLILFSDAVVAIAITLLVLPVLDTATERGDISDVLSEAWPRILAFVISFAVVGSFWQSHRKIFAGIGAVSGPLIWANLFWLLTIAFLQFPAEVLGVRDTEETAVRALYVGALLAVSIAQLLLSVVINGDRSLWRDGRRPEISLHASYVGTAVFTAVFLVATFVPAVGLFALFALLLIGPVSARLDRRRGTV
jgi:uncharacterized membrane protein